MTAELGPSSRALLDAARAGMSPSEAAIKRMRANVANATATSVASGTLAVKLGLIGLLGAVAVGALVSRDAGPSDHVVSIDLTDLTHLTHFTDLTHASALASTSQREHVVVALPPSPAAPSRLASVARPPPHRTSFPRSRGRAG